MLFGQGLTNKAEKLLKLAGEKHMRVATAESCTGGLISALLTEIPGSSIVIGRSFVTYSNRAKHEILHVPANSCASMERCRKKWCAQWRKTHSI